MLFLLFAFLFSTANSFVWHQLENGTALEDQEGRYFAYTAEDGEYFRTIRFVISSPAVLQNVQVRSCYPEGTEVALRGCVGTTDCTLWVRACDYKPGTTYFVVVNRVGNADVAVTLTASEFPVEVLTLGSQTINVSTPWDPSDRSPDAYRILRYDVGSTSALNQLYAETSPALLAQAFFAYTANEEAVCTSQVSPLFQNGFSAYLENEPSCSSQGVGPRYIYAGSASTTGWVAITAVVNSPTTTAIVDGTQFFNWTVNSERPVGFYHYDVAEDSYSTVSFLSSLLSGQCTVTTSSEATPANYGTCPGDDLSRSNFGLLTPAVYTFGPCDSGRWYFSVVCPQASTGNNNYNIRVQTETTATSSFDYNDLEYGANFSNTGDETVYLTLTNTADNSIEAGNPQKIITVKIFENGAAPINADVYLTRSLIDPEQDFTRCSGVDRASRTLIALTSRFAGFSWWPCQSTTQTGNVNLVLSPNGNIATADYDLVATVQSPSDIEQNGTVQGTTFAGASQIYSLDYSRTDLVEITITGTSGLELALRNSETCEDPQYWEYEDKIVTFCQPTDNVLLEVRSTAGAPLIENGYEITATTYPLASSIRHWWDDTDEDFELTTDQNFQVVEFDIEDDEAFLLTFEGTAGAQARISIYQDCELITTINNCGRNCQYERILDVFEGRVRVTFSVDDPNPTGAPVYTLSYTGGRAAACQRQSVVGLFCGPVLDPLKYYYCPDGQGDCGAVGGDVDDEARRLYERNLLFFNETVTPFCEATLRKFTCQAIYFECESNGEIDTSCDSQCDDIQEQCGNNKCFYDGCVAAEEALCTPSSGSFISFSPLVLLVLGVLSFLV